MVKNTVLREKIDEDLKEAQWMISSFKELGIVLQLITEKHTEAARGSAADSAGVAAFFAYFSLQWGPESHVAR